MSTTVRCFFSCASISSSVPCIPPVRMDTATCAAPFSGVAWLMVTMDAPAAGDYLTRADMARMLSAAIAVLEKR